MERGVWESTGERQSLLPKLAETSSFIDKWGSEVCCSAGKFSPLSNVLYLSNFFWDNDRWVFFRLLFVSYAAESVQFIFGLRFSDVFLIEIWSALDYRMTLPTGILSLTELLRPLRPILSNNQPLSSRPLHVSTNNLHALIPRDAQVWSSRLLSGRLWPLQRVELLLVELPEQTRGFSPPDPPCLPTARLNSVSMRTHTWIVVIE